MFTVSLLLQHYWHKSQDLYLSPISADVWFVFGEERVPAHQFILAKSSEYYTTQFKWLPDNGEVNMSNSKVTVNSFKDFLQFYYRQKVNFTSSNIKDITNLAHQYLNEDLLNECENFLVKTIKTENFIDRYKMSLMYKLKKLETTCKNFATSFVGGDKKFFQDDAFLDCPSDLLESIVKNNQLSCDEKIIFDTCVAWAKRKQQNVGYRLLLNSRHYLKNIIYEIRFSSMSREEVFMCFEHNLFTIDEKREIDAMLFPSLDFKPKKFNWTPRPRQYNHNVRSNFFNSHRNNCYGLFRKSPTEGVTFTKNNNTQLVGFYIKNDKQVKEFARICMYETDENGKCYLMYNQQKLLDFSDSKKLVNQFLALVRFKNPMLLTPNRSYTIIVRFLGNSYKRTIRLYDLILVDRYQFIEQRYQRDFRPCIDWEVPKKFTSFRSYIDY